MVAAIPSPPFATAAVTRRGPMETCRRILSMKQISRDMVGVEYPPVGEPAHQLNTPPWA